MILLKKLLVVLLCLLLFTGIPEGQRVFADEFSEDEPFIGVFANSDASIAKIPKIDAGAAIVMDLTSGRILFEKNAYTRRPMASTTKIMTAIVAIENGSMEDMVTVSKKASGIRGSTIHLKEGQKLKLEELMYGLMLQSGNDAAIAIGEHIGGTLENFLDMMNKKAGEIGAKNTYFKSPHGLDIDGHYTTAYDLALITKYALGNPMFSQIVGTKNAFVNGKSIHSTNEMLDIYPGADGVKTGYTGKAGRCLVTSATRNNWRLISVVLSCPTRYKRAESSKKILDHAFANYKHHMLLAKDENVRALKVQKGIVDQVGVKASKEIKLPLREDEIEAVETRISLPGTLRAPVRADMTVGYIEFLLNGEVIARSELKTASGIRHKGVADYLGDLFKTWARMMREGIFL